MEGTKLIAFDFITELQNKNITAREWEKVKSFVDNQYQMEKNKSTLKCDKNALISEINGQIW